MRGSHCNKIHPMGIPQLSDPSPRYSCNIHTHTHGKPADSAGFPLSPSPAHLCSELVCGRSISAILCLTRAISHQGWAAAKSQAVPCVPVRWTLSYKKHVTKTATKLKSRNHLLFQTGGYITACQSGLCYSLAEYWSPMWAKSSNTRPVHSQLNSSMWLISGTLRPIQLPWLPNLLTLLHQNSNVKLHRTLF